MLLCSFHTWLGVRDDYSESRTQFFYMYLIWIGLCYNAFVYLYIQSSILLSYIVVLWGCTHYFTQEKHLRIIVYIMKFSYILFMLFHFIYSWSKLLSNIALRTLLENINKLFYLFRSVDFRKQLMKSFKTSLKFTSHIFSILFDCENYLD